MQYNRISADSHLDLPWLPGDVFVSNASAALRDEMPYVENTADGARWTTKKGVALGFVNGTGPLGRKFVLGSNARYDRMTDLFEDGAKGIRRVSDPHLRVKEMDRDGIDAEVIYGMLGVALQVEDRKVLNEMLRIYADWLKGFCDAYPDRLIGLASLPYGDVDAAVREVYRIAKMGFRGFELSVAWDMEPMWHPIWEPLWAAVNDVDLPIHFHASPPLTAMQMAKYPPSTRVPNSFTSICNFQMSTANLIAALMSTAAFERYPNLRVAFGESGIGWIPYLLDRMDNERDHFPTIPLKMKPSEYWRRQCRASFQIDMIGTKLLDDMGVETVMWANDFPHQDGTWPDSDETIKHEFKDLPADVVKKITCDNAKAFYRLS